MDRDIEDVARRLEARAFLYGDPGSFREGVAEALRAVATERRRLRPADRAPAVEGSSERRTATAR